MNNGLNLEDGFLIEFCFDSLKEWKKLLSGCIQEGDHNRCFWNGFVRAFADVVCVIDVVLVE